MMLPPGVGLVIIFDKNGRETRFDPLHLVATKEGLEKSKRKWQAFTLI